MTLLHLVTKTEREQSNASNPQGKSAAESFVLQFVATTLCVANIILGFVSFCIIRSCKERMENIGS